MPKSIVAPFQVVGGRIADTTDIARIIEQKIVNVLTTGKFERPGIPEYGVGVQSLLFEDIDSLVEVDFKTDASSELSDNVSGLSLVDIRVDRTHESQAEITVHYRTPLSNVRSTTFTIQLPGTLTEESPL